MDRAALERIARELMLGRRSHTHRETGWLYYHGLRTAKLALSLRERLFPDERGLDDCLYAAGLFHDIGKGDEPHTESGSRMVLDVLDGHLPPEQLSLVSKWIAQHQLRGHTELELSNGAKLLMDADLIDHAGSINVWLGCCHTYHDGNSIDALVDYFESGGLSTLRSWERLTWFEFSHKILKERNDFVASFMERLKLEAGGGFYLP